MEIYKRAAILKLRFQTQHGPLSTEQLFDLKMTELAKLIKAQNEVIKKSRTSEDAELDFLESSSDGKENIEILRFDILKDIYLEKKHQKEQDAEDVKKKQELERIDELIAKKQDEELENKSIDELLEMRKNLLK